MHEETIIKPVGSERLMSVKDVCRQSGTGETYVRAEIRCGALPAFKLGSAIRIKPTDYENWLSRKAVA